MNRTLHASLAALFVLFVVHAVAFASIDAAKVPLFQWRARVTSAGGQGVDGKKFSFKLERDANEAAGGTWSAWTPFDLEDVKVAVGNHSYPNMYMNDFPVVLKLSVGGVVDPTVVEVEVKFDGQDNAMAMKGELYSPVLGLMVWREKDNAPRVATMAEYNRRYWDALKGVNVGGKTPKVFPVVDRFIGGDGDRIGWREGIEQLSHGGFNAIMLPPDKKIREMLLATGNRRTAWAVYSPPGYVFDHDPKITPDAIKKFAEEQAKPYLDAGYERKDMAVYALSDEPGWYYPAAFDALKANKDAMNRFRDYLVGQQLKPGDVGLAKWDDLKPLGRAEAKDLPSKRLFYWTMRFFAWDSSRHFAATTRAMEEAFYPNMPIFTNWNFFSGRLYVPGPVANNGAKQDPNAAMGGHDWFEFARMRGGTMLWTEDWFGDEQAYQWSFYCAKMRSAAATCPSKDVEFGGYVIPRTAGQRERGIVQKIVTIAGMGGKTLKYFVFGPEYNFPGNCYSENIKVLPQMAEAHAMIGAAEELLWPGRPAKAQVAILMPRSAQMWDAKDIAIPNQIEDATNNHLNNATVDYMAEVFNIYTALQHANIPCDFVDEDDLSAKGLKGYAVLYATEPNIPEEGQRGLMEWVRAGGVLVTVPGTGSRGRYDEPCQVLRLATGILEGERERMLVANLPQLQAVARGDGELGEFSAVGVKSEILLASSAGGGPLKVGARFGDGSPAILRAQFGPGQVFHFAWMPGLSYAATAKHEKGKLPTGWSKSIRDWIVFPTKFAKIDPPVETNQALVETPLLLSDKGAVVTVLNWNNEAIKELKVKARVGFAARSVESVKQGALKFKNKDGAVEFELPAGAADFVLIRK